MDTLIKFNEAKIKMAQIIVNAKKFTSQLNEQAIANQLDIVYTTLIREQFEVIVVGEFSNGKSTFINALLKNLVLPASNVPTTALINKITYGPQPMYHLQYENGKKEQITYEEFVEYVAEDKQIVDGKSANFFTKLKDKFKQVNHIQIGYPSDLCKNNVVIIDSPGTNDMDERRVKITDEYIPKSDAAIFVLNAMRIFTASEKAFLQRILDADIQKIFFVINFKDYVKSPEEFAEIEMVVKSNLPEFLESPKIHFVSSLHALKYYQKQNGQEEIEGTSRRAQRKQMAVIPFEETGIQEFEQALHHFLTYERGVEKLRKPVERVTNLLEDVIENRIIFEQKSLNNAIDDIKGHVEGVRQELNKVENELNTNLNRWKRQLDERTKTVVKMYNDSLQQVTTIANTELRKGIDFLEDPEVIKTNIDLATGKVEKEINQTVRKEINILVDGITKEASEYLQSELSNLTSNVLDLSRGKDNWEGKITRRVNKVSKATGATSIGLGLLGGVAIIVTGGAVGWGMAAAAVAGGAVTKYIEESDSSLYERLEKQVDNRYLKAIPRKRKEIEAQMVQISTQTIASIKATILEKLVQERKKAQTLLDNHSLDAEKQSEKLKQLQTQQLIAESLINNMQKEFESFKEAGVYNR